MKIKNLNDTRKNTKINKNESIRKVEERVFEKNQIQPTLELKKENKESLTESEIKTKYES